MWESIIDAIAQIFRKIYHSSTPKSTSTKSDRFDIDSVNLDQLFKNKEDERLFAEIVKEEWQKIKPTIKEPEDYSQDRRRMHHTRGSKGHKQPRDEFEYWLNTAPIPQIKRFAMNVVHKYLQKRYHFAGTWLTRSHDILLFAPLSQNKIIHHKLFNTSQRWYYLINTLHSDRCIWRIRRRNISADKLRCQMELRFLKGPSHSYMYYSVPMFVFAEMTLINLTYLTKNGYLAGAYNYFYYSCLLTQRVKHDPPQSRATRTGVKKAFRIFKQNRKRGTTSHLI